MIAEAGQNYPFDSINKLYFLGNKAEDAAEREWLFIAIDDLHQADKLRHGELAATVLKKKKGTQYVDVLMFKKVAQRSASCQNPSTWLIEGIFVDTPHCSAVTQ